MREPGDQSPSPVSVCVCVCACVFWCDVSPVLLHQTTTTTSTNTTTTTQRRRKTSQRRRRRRRRRRKRRSPSNTFPSTAYGHSFWPKRGPCLVRHSVAHYTHTHTLHTHTHKRARARTHGGRSGYQRHQHRATTFFLPFKVLAISVSGPFDFFLLFLLLLLLLHRLGSCTCPVGRRTLRRRRPVVVGRRRGPVHESLADASLVKHRLSEGPLSSFSLIISYIDWRPNLAPAVVLLSLSFSLSNWPMSFFQG